MKIPSPSRLFQIHPTAKPYGPATATRRKWRPGPTLAVDVEILSCSPRGNPSEFVRKPEMLFCAFERARVWVVPVRTRNHVWVGLDEPHGKYGCPFMGEADLVLLGVAGEVLGVLVGREDTSLGWDGCRKRSVLEVELPPLRVLRRGWVDLAKIFLQFRTASVLS